MAEPQSPQDYLAILKRRKWHIAISAVGIFLISVLVAFIWPPTYRSSATILIEEPDVPRDLVRSTVAMQRVALARALAAEPEIILLDEPFRALDAITRAELVEGVQALLREIGVTALLVTHDIRTALEIADRVAVLRGGRFEQIAPAAELRSSPASPYVRQLLDRAGEASFA